jgi:hypothetical protein
VGSRELLPDLEALDWSDRDVGVAFDRDGPRPKKQVRKEAQKLAKVLGEKGAKVKVVWLPATPDGSKVGPDDYLRNHTKEELRALLVEAPTAIEALGAGKDSLADMLAGMVRASGADLFKDADDVAFATIPVGGHAETWPLKSRGFKSWVRHAFFKRYEKAVPASALADAVATLEGCALYEGKTCAVHVRVAGHEGKVYVDLVDPDWRAVEVDAAGWRIVERSPVRFRRAKAMAPLPAPVRGGSVGDLRPFLNMNDDDFVLAVAWLVGAFHPDGPYTALTIHGPHGSTKSTSARVVRSLVDPSTMPLRAEPHGERDLAIASGNAWVIGFDNISYLEPWLSDALCRLATGGGFGTRTLYENDEETILSAKHPVILNGIEEFGTRPDFLDRNLSINCRELAPGQRKPERVFREEFNAAQPRILGAVLDAVSAGLRNLPTAEVDPDARMSDFAQWVAACEPALGWQVGTFRRVYAKNRAGANELALEASSVGPYLLRLKLPWRGTASELLAELEQLAPDRETRRKAWPLSGRGVSGALRRLKPNLRAAGIEVGFGRDGHHSNTRQITITRTSPSAKAPSAPSALSAPSAPGENKLENGEKVRTVGGPRPSAPPGNRPPAADGPSANGADGVVVPSPTGPNLVADGWPPSADGRTPPTVRTQLAKNELENGECGRSHGADDLPATSSHLSDADEEMEVIL